ncbi:MAG: hypothetical protein EZS28_016700 [Streblomastix strix]|uniref:Uncharacterized protein n=1 Tax=Streblomastix strix TaxID=222440 RepID=A0A5J4VYN3_9EUKA|nr:MAG: hypothetical protein EZS28_016700 [Streblomastix strix]
MNRNLECFLLHPPIRMILRTLSKIWRGQATALVIMPNLREQFCNELQYKLTESLVVSGKAEEIKIVGDVMKKNELKLPPENLKAIKMISIGQEKFYPGRFNGAMIMEIWRKRRARIYIMKENIDEKEMNLDEMKQIRPDMMLVNMMTYWNDKHGTKSVVDMYKIRTHVGVALGMFHNNSDVANSNIVVAAMKDLDLAQRSQSKYSRTWNLDLLLSYMSKEE